MRHIRLTWRASAAGGTTAGIVLAQNAGADAKASVDAATEPPHGHAVPVASPARDFSAGGRREIVRA